MKRLILNRHNLFETSRQWLKKNWICRKKLLSSYQTEQVFHFQLIMSCCRNFFYPKKEILQFSKIYCCLKQLMGLNYQKTFFFLFHTIYELVFLFVRGDSKTTSSGRGDGVTLNQRKKCYEWRGCAQTLMPPHRKNIPSF